MNENFETMLLEGGKLNTLGRAEEVVEIVLDDTDRIEELYRCLFSDDAWVRMRAIDALEKICRKRPDLLLEYIDRLIHDFGNNDQPSIQWHLAQIFAEVELSERQRTQAVEILTRNISTTTGDWIVTANSMTTLVDFARRGYIRDIALQPMLQRQLQHKSQSVQKRAQKLLDQLSLQ